MNHYLYLTNTRLVSLLARGKRFVERHELAISGAGATELERLLERVHAVPLNIFTDLAEEDFRPDTIPHVGRGDREAVVSRRLGQMFRNTPYRHALLQGREAEGRRDDRVLYAAITNGEVLRPWLDVLERRQVPIAGIHSAAVVGSRLIEALGIAAEHALLVLFTPGDALRQSYFRHKELRFTRVAPIDRAESASLGEFIAEETLRTWQYLDNLRSFGAQDQLHVYVLAHAKDQPAIAAALRDSPQLKYALLDMEQVAARIGLKPAPAHSSCEEVLVHVFRERPAENHFASAELRRYWTLARARRLVNAASAAILAAGLALSSWNLARIFQESASDQRVAREIDSLNREYDQVSRSLPSFGVGGAAMRDAVAFYNGYIRGFPTPMEVLVPLSGVLEKHPEVHLTQLAWQATDDAKSMPAMPLAPPRAQPPVKAIGKAEAVQRPMAEDPSPVFSAGRFEVALVEATVSVPRDDFRAALDAVERLAHDIGAIPGFQADVVESPLDVRSSIGLAGKHAEREAALMEPRFILRVVRDHASAT